MAIKTAGIHAFLALIFGTDIFPSTSNPKDPDSTMSPAQRRFLLIPGLLLPLAAFFGACDRAAPPEPIPPRVLYYQPSQTDSVDLREHEEQLFVLICQAGAGAEYESWVDDRVVAHNHSFVFRPSEHGLTWPETTADTSVTVRMSLRDGETVLARAWKVGVTVTPGIEFIAIPEERDLVTFAGLPIAFHMEVLNADDTVHYNYRLDGSWVVDGRDYFFTPLQVGDYVLDGHAWWAGGHSLHYIWHIEVRTGEDQNPPEDIDDLRLGPGELPGDLVIAFTPPSDGPDGLVLKYELRAFYQLVPLEEWDSTYLLGLVDASPWQEEERFVIHGLETGHEIYLRARSYDNSGNASGWSNVDSSLVAGHTVAGRLVDYETGEPIEGFQVRYGQIFDQTGPDGRFHCPHVETLIENHNFPPGNLRDELGAELGEWFDLVDYRAVNDSVELDLGSFRVEPLVTESYPSFLAYFLEMMNAAQWSYRLVKPYLPIRTYIEEYTNEGLSYDQLVHDSIEIWEEDSGLSFFTEVPSIEEADLFFRFIPDTSNFSGSYQVLEREPDTFVPLLAMIHLNGSYTAAAEDGARRVVLHELGHALGPLQHSNDTDHVLATVNTVNRPSPDELRLVRALYHMEAAANLGLLAEE